MFSFYLPSFWTVSVVFFFPFIVKTWQVDGDCGVNTAAAMFAGLIAEPSLGSDLAHHVTAAALEAQSIAQYMACKASTGPRVGNLMQDLLGAPNEDDPLTLAAIGTAVTSIIAAMNVPSTNQGGSLGLIIHCSDKHLTSIDVAKGIFRDTKRSNARVEVPRFEGTLNPTSACGWKLQGFSYNYPGGQVIVLCSDTPWGAAKVYSEATLKKWRAAGDLRRNPHVESLGVDGLGGALSVKILHELFHVGGFYLQARTGFGSENSFPQILPENVNGERSGEVYSWTKISGKKIGDTTASKPPLTPGNALHNADSMALLGAGWYVPRYAWVDGVCKTVRPENQSPLEFGGQGIPLAPDGYGGFEDFSAPLYPDKRAINDFNSGDGIYEASFTP